MTAWVISMYTLTTPMSCPQITAHTYLVTFLIHSVKMKYTEVSSLVAVLALSFVAVTSAEVKVDNPIIDANVSTIRFYLWTRLNPGTLRL